MKKTIIILLGLPGAGKGTQGEILAKKLFLPHISTGDIFRRMVNENSEDAKLLAGCISNGKLVSSDLANKIVKNFILSNKCQVGCILDGYPRNYEQAKYLIDYTGSNVTIIFFDISNELAIQRILGRIVCGSCNTTYNKYSNSLKVEGVCDKCGKKSLIVRSDDDKNTIISRIDEYRKNTLPMIEFYRDNSNFFTVDGGRSKEIVAKEIASIVKMV